MLLAEAAQDKTTAFLQVEWYLNTLPANLADDLRKSMAMTRHTEESKGGQYRPDLSAIMDLAIRLNTNFQRRRAHDGAPAGTTSSGANDSGRRAVPSANKSSRRDNYERGARNSNSRSSNSQKGPKCFKCLQYGHMSTECKAPSKPTWCHRCKATHEFGKHTKSSKGKPAFLGGREKAKQEKPKRKFRTTLYTEGTINDKEVHVTIDTGTPGPVITKEALKRIGREIDEPTTVILRQIRGDAFRLLGEVKDLVLNIDGMNFTFDALVADVPDYELVLGLEWLYDVGACIDICNMQLVAL